MLINDDTGRAASKNYTGVFYGELENNPLPSWLKLAFWVIFSSVRTEIIAFSKGFPGFIEWIGPRKVNSFSQYSVTISKKDWEDTVGVQRDDVEMDKLDIVLKQIRGMAQMVPKHFLDLFIALLRGGATTVCYDGANFFDTTHPNGLDASGAADVFVNKTANAFSVAEWELAKTRAGKIKNPDSGKSLAINWSHIIYGNKAESAVENVFGRTLINGGDSNIYLNQIKPENRIKLLELGDTAAWYLFDFTKMLQAFVLMIVKGVNFVPFDKPTDWIPFSTKQYVYGGDMQDNATYLLPELVYASTVA